MSIVLCLLVLPVIVVIWLTAKVVSAVVDWLDWQRQRRHDELANARWRYNLSKMGEKEYEAYLQSLIIDHAHNH